MMDIKGHHHVSIYTKNAHDNIRFYRDILGLRFVKQTVHQDTHDMYHLFYGDSTGSPGTELTFFEMPYLGTRYHGTNAITSVGLLIEHEQSLHFWQTRFNECQIPFESIRFIHQRLALPFEDPDGLKLYLIVKDQTEALPTFWKKWEKSPIPLQHQILGIGPVKFTVSNLNHTKDVLMNLLGYTEMFAGEQLAVFQTEKGAAYSEIIVREMAGPKERPGRGTIHHLAIRVANLDTLHQWDQKIKAYGFQTTGVVNRYYFHSLYFTDENGIHYELATDGPGFLIDEAWDDLGSKLCLPPFIEHKRQQIESILKPLS